jgi:hypothetical protein
LKYLCETEISKLKNEHTKYEILINKNCEIENEQRRNSVAQSVNNEFKLISGSYNLCDQDMNEKTALTEKKNENDLRCSKSILADDQRILKQEEKDIDLILSMALTWGPKVDTREQQVFIHTFVYIHANKCKCVHIYLSIYIYIYIHTYLYVYINVNTCTGSITSEDDRGDVLRARYSNAISYSRI